MSAPLFERRDLQHTIRHPTRSLRATHLPSGEIASFEAGILLTNHGEHMSGPIFVWDAHKQPLMPISAAHARKLRQQGVATPRPHHAFTILQLSRTVAQ